MKIANFRNHSIQRSCDKKYKDYHSYKKYLQKDFSNRCCYCNLCEDTIGVIPLQIDHFIPRKQFAEVRDELDTDYKNLVLSCPKCNRAKGDQYEGDIGSPKIENSLFYNPDQVDYNDIFYRNELGQIVSDDPKGQDMIKRLKLYRPIHSYAWILERLGCLIDRLEAKISNETGEEKLRLQKIRGQLLAEHYKLDKQFRAIYLE